MLTPCMQPVISADKKTDNAALPFGISHNRNAATKPGAKIAIPQRNSLWISFRLIRDAICEHTIPNKGKAIPVRIETELAK